MNKAYLGFLPFCAADEGVGCTIGELLTTSLALKSTQYLHIRGIGLDIIGLESTGCQLVNNLPLIMGALTVFTQVNTMLSHPSVIVKRLIFFNIIITSLGGFAIAGCRLIFSFQGFF
jgi:hypothetical protein